MVNTIRGVYTLLMLFAMPFFLAYREGMKAGWLLAAICFWLPIPVLSFFVEQGIRRLAFVLMGLGTISNVTALAVNHWQMPVAHMTAAPHGVWRPLLATDRLQLLCDVLPGQMSIGDVLTFSGCLLAVLLYFANYKPTSMSKLFGKP